MKSYPRLKFAVGSGLITMVFISTVLAFDFGTWIFSPIDWVHRDLTISGCTDSIKELHALSAYRKQAEWSDSAHISCLAIWTPPTSTLPYTALAPYDLKITNNWWPDDGVYSESKFRYVTHSNNWPVDSNAYGLWTSYFGKGIAVVGEGSDRCFQYITDSLDALDAYHTIRKPEGCIDYTWNGWSELSNPYMPFHFRIICDAIVDLDSVSTHPFVASATWFIRDGDSGDWCTEGGNWTAYPAMKIPATSFTPPAWNGRTAFEFTINPIQDSLFYEVEFNDIESDDYSIDTLSSTPDSGHVFDKRHSARLLVSVDGAYDFRLYRVDIWDEGWDRLVENSTPAWEDTIASYFETQYNLNPNNCAGWMKDDITKSYMLSAAYITKILYDRDLPPLISSSSYDQDFVNLLDNLGVPHPVLAFECYWLGADSTCQPSGPDIPLTDWLWTSRDSDVDYYLELEPEPEPPCFIDYNPDNPGCTHQTYNGRKSLQCALDLGMWGWESYRYANNYIDAWYYDEHEEQAVGGMYGQIEWLHDRNVRSWPMLLSGRYGRINGNYCNRWEYWTSMRAPDTCEVRLQAWIAVAGDADGIMWYGALGDWDTLRYSGMFDLAAGAHDGPPLEYGTNGNTRRNFCEEKYIRRTNSYYEAKDVHEKILRISPVLETLHLEKISTSRAFEINYGEVSQAATNLESISGVVAHRIDTLRNDLNPSCTLDSIWAYKYIVTPTHDCPPWYEQLEHKDSTYVQVSRFSMPGAGPEDYYFLIVNRRVLADSPPGAVQPEGEKRKVYLGIDNVEYPGSIYVVDRLVSGTTDVAASYETNGKKFYVDLDPGDAEFVHFYKQPETSDLVLTQNTTITTPAFYARNIVVNDANLTIQPNLSLLADSIIYNGQWTTMCDSVATIFFAPGKGIIINNTNDDANDVQLNILGNDSIRIKLMAPTDNPDARWAGITINGMGDDEINIEHAEIAYATTGLRFHNHSCAGQINVNIDDVRFTNNSNDYHNGYGLWGMGIGSVDVYDSHFSGGDHGMLVNRGIVAQVDSTTIVDCTGIGIVAGTSSTLTLDDVTIMHCQGQSGVRVYSSDLMMRDCLISDNDGNGIDATNSGIYLAEPTDGATEEWGYNNITNNGIHQIEIHNASVFAMLCGGNTIYGSTSNPDNKWIKAEWSDDTPLGIDFAANYWGGYDSQVVEDMIEPEGVNIYPILTEPPTPATEPSMCDDDDPNDCIINGSVKEKEQLFEDAKVIYRDLIEATEESCLRGSSIRRYTATIIQSEASLDSTLVYYGSIKDTTSDTLLVKELKESEAFIKYATCELEDSRDDYDAIVDDAGANIYRTIEGEVGLKSLDLTAAILDTTDPGLTDEKIDAYAADIEKTLAQRNVWTQYAITDSVVMYAPMRVDSQITILDGGVLTILPHPGVKDPVVRFTMSNAYTYGWIIIAGIDTTKPCGKLYVQGTPDSKVVMRWDSLEAGYAAGLFNNRAYVKLEHAELEGGGWLNYDYTWTENRRSCFQADFCTFRWFDEGIVFWKTDPSSYVSDCTFEQVGTSYLQDPVGGGEACIVIYQSDDINIENCAFDERRGQALYLQSSSDVAINGNTFTDGDHCAIWMSGGDVTMSCCDLSSVGDTLDIAEIYVLDGTLDMTGGHNSIAAATRNTALIYALDPSYVELEEGENILDLNDNDGYYLRSGDTTQTWDITWNTWAPYEPDDPEFYDHLYPSNPAKWTVDSSLTSFLACGESAQSSIGGSNWMITPVPYHEAATSSIDDDADVSTMLDVSQASAKSAQVDSKASSKQALKGPVSKAAIDASKSLVQPDDRKSSAASIKQATKAEMVRRHHEELSKWREVKALSKRGDKRATLASAKQLMDDHPTSKLVPAAMTKLSTLARQLGRNADVSKYLLEQSQTLPDAKDRLLAKRLGYKAMAFEGEPKNALTQLESMMVSTTTPKDSVLALMDAMQVYFDFHRVETLSPRFDNVKVESLPELIKRTLYLTRVMDDPNLAPDKQPVAMPKEYKLYQNYPNPFNPSTEIKFDLPETVPVKLMVYNILGQQVVTLVDEVRAAGTITIPWDGKNAAGVDVSAGMYIYQIKAGPYSKAKKMLLLR